jgi:hypothetical protein
MVRVMRLLYRALGRGHGIALGSRSNSDWDEAASPPTTLQPVQPRLGPEPLEDLASLGVYAIGFFVLPLGREPI